MPSCSNFLARVNAHSQIVRKTVDSLDPVDFRMRELPAEFVTDGLQVLYYRQTNQPVASVFEIDCTSVNAFIKDALLICSKSARGCSDIAHYGPAEIEVHSTARELTILWRTCLQLSETINKIEDQSRPASVLEWPSKY